MLFHVSWERIDSSEVGLKRSNELFSKWTPGPAKFQGFCGFADAAIGGDPATWRDAN